jgi:hypothetical protein
MTADSNLKGDANVVDNPSWERPHQMLVGLARRRADSISKKGSSVSASGPSCCR